ncbi:MAG: GGDEF domain-containing protein [Pseudomonadales bacterium]|jgi:diguanylate cyclase (GGDEF)-like protein|nr:GGDEF domain-containing protein [Pseudomonadales bacterium]
MESQSLLLTLTLVAGISCLAVFINWASNRHIPGLLAIAFGFLINNLGFVLLSTQGMLTPLLSIVLAYILILAGRIPVLAGLARFWGQEKSRLPLISVGLFLLTAAAIIWFTSFNSDPIWRIRIYSSLMVFFSLANISLILNGLRVQRRLRPVMSASSNFGAFLAIMLFGFNAVTEFILMIVRTGELATRPEDGLALLLLGSIFTTVVFAFAIIIMTMEELTVEHKENAVFDPVTTILNHRSFMEVGQRILGVALRYSQPVTLLSIEVENMDEVVKKHGYKIANEMLKHFSLVTTDRRRHEDILARSGQNRFIMLLPGVDEEGAGVVSTKIRNSLSSAAFEYRGESIDVQVSIAPITCREEDLDLQQMLQEGEVELFRLRNQIGMTQPAPA